MTRSIINLDPNRKTNQPLFFGESLGLQRYDLNEHQRLEVLTDRQHGFFWRPTDIVLAPDALDWQNSMSEDDKHIYTSNLQYQILLDSQQGRGILEVFGKYISCPQLEDAMNAWQFFETIHSRSYTYIIKNIYNNPSEVFDEVLRKPEIIARAEKSCEHYNNVINSDYSGTFGAHQKYEDIYLALVSVNILEGLRFYTSFACSFAFAELRKMQKSASILSLIARDESLHLQFSQYILNTLPTESGSWKKTADRLKPVVADLYRDAVNQEVEWANYLFKGRNMLGLNAKILEQYIKWLANIRIGAIGLPKLYDISTENPIPWINKYLNSNNFQPEPQATEILSYVMGSIDNSEQSDFSSFEL